MKMKNKMIGSKGETTKNNRPSKIMKNIMRRRFNKILIIIQISLSILNHLELKQQKVVVKPLVMKNCPKQNKTGSKITKSTEKSSHK